MWIALVGALRLGIVMRRRRLAGAPPGTERIDQHARWARSALWMLGVGLLGGPVSAVWLRDWAPLGTLHGWLGLFAGCLLFAAGWMGRSLKLGRSRAVVVHGGLALAGVGLAALATVAGFVLLP